MPDPISPSSADLGELLSTQQRLLEAFARTSRIVAEAARGCAERQAELTRAALHDLLAGTPLAGGVPSTDALQEQVGRMAALLERIGQEVGQMQRIVVEAQQAVLAELGRALETASGRAPEAAPAAAPDPASPDSPAPEPAAERPRPRRPRKLAVPS
jgi:hypothetical protein